MTEVPFHTTRMAVLFYEHSVPELIAQLERLTAALERIAATLERKEKNDGDEAQKVE